MFPGCYKIPIGISASGPNSRTLIAWHSGGPRHVGRNYVPLLCGVDTALRYYVIRDVIVLQIMCFHW